mmetsp:Transcript_35814/g.40711  ORF Transcript_35814/g.40711 Transcript_35814/m.40711 type:complete len:1138 (+) Transcript_35814:108-3521(+)
MSGYGFNSNEGQAGLFDHGDFGGQMSLVDQNPEYFRQHRAQSQYDSRQVAQTSTNSGLQFNDPSWNDPNSSPGHRTGEGNFVAGQNLGNPINNVGANLDPSAINDGGRRASYDFHNISNRFNPMGLAGKFGTSMGNNGGNQSGMMNTRGGVGVTGGNDAGGLQFVSGEPLLNHDENFRESSDLRGLNLSPQRFHTPNMMNLHGQAQLRKLNSIEHQQQHQGQTHFHGGHQQYGHVAGMSGNQKMLGVNSQNPGGLKKMNSGDGNNRKQSSPNRKSPLMTGQSGGNRNMMMNHSGGNYCHPSSLNSSPTGGQGGRRGSVKSSAISRTLPVVHLELSTFKTRPCRTQQQHNPKHCEYYHSAKDRKRAGHHYHFDMCGEVQKNESCSHKDDCRRAHNMVEQLYHKDKYKTKFCTFYPDNLDNCDYKMYCSFAHSEADIKVHLIHKMNRDEEFYMFYYKTVWCPYNTQHDKALCVYAHNWQDYRRKPHIYHYENTPCPAWKSDTFILTYEEGCVKEGSCIKCHGWKEQEYHPLNYKTRSCTSGRNCQKGQDCPYYHSQADRRIPGTPEFRLIPQSETIDAHINDELVHDKPYETDFQGFKAMQNFDIRFNGNKQRGGGGGEGHALPGGNKSHTPLIRGQNIRNASGVNFSTPQLNSRNSRNMYNQHQMYNMTSSGGGRKFQSKIGENTSPSSMQGFGGFGNIPEFDLDSGESRQVGTANNPLRERDLFQHGNFGNDDGFQLGGMQGLHSVSHGGSPNLTGRSMMDPRLNGPLGRELGSGKDEEFFSNQFKFNLISANVEEESQGSSHEANDTVISRSGSGATALDGLPQGGILGSMRMIHKSSTSSKNSSSSVPSSPFFTGLMHHQSEGGAADPNFQAYGGAPGLTINRGAPTGEGAGGNGARKQLSPFAKPFKSSANKANKLEEDEFNLGGKTAGAIGSGKLSTGWGPEGREQDPSLSSGIGLFGSQNWGGFLMGDQSAPGANRSKFQSCPTTPLTLNGFGGPVNNLTQMNLPKSLVEEEEENNKLRQFFEKLGLPHLAKSFSSQQIEYNQLKALKETDLQRLIKDPGELARVAKACTDLHENDCNGDDLFDQIDYMTGRKASLQGDDFDSPTTGGDQESILGKLQTLRLNEHKSDSQGK